MQALAGARPGDSAPGRELGASYLGEARPFGALWAYSFALRARPDDAEAALGAARALESALFPARAIQTLRDLSSRQGAPPEAVSRLVLLHLQTGQPKEALRLLEGAGEAFLNRPGSRMLEGRVREGLGDLDGAQRAYRRALGHGAEDVLAWRRLGLMALKQGRIADARRSLEQAYALDSRDPGTLVDLARAVAAGGKPSDRQAAMGFFREAAKSEPYAPAYYHSGRMLAQGGDLAQAEHGFRLAIGADPRFADAYLALADLLDRTGRRVEAHHERGVYFSLKDLRAEAMREFVAMAAADPTRADGLLLASQSLFDMMQRARAAEMARRALARCPRDSQARERLAGSLILANNGKAAARICEEWLKEEPGAVPPLWMLGRIAADAKRHAEAITYFERVLAVQPENADVLEALGVVLVNAPGSDHLPRALETLGHAVALAPTSTKARYWYGIALRDAGRPEEALRQLLRALDLDPHRGETYNLVVQLARQLKQPGAVALFGGLVRDVEERLRVELRLWRRTWDQPEDPEGFLALARFLITRTELTKSESQLEYALRLRPRWPEAAAELARVRRLLVATADYS